MARGGRGQRNPLRRYDEGERSPVVVGSYLAVCLVIGLFAPLYFVVHNAYRIAILWKTLLPARRQAAADPAWHNRMTVRILTRDLCRYTLWGAIALVWWVALRHF